MDAIDQYIAGFPEEIQILLEQIRSAIHESAPGAEETISYAMPAFRLNGPLIYFAAFKKHIGFYPTASGIEAFKDEIMMYKHARGSVQFPVDKPMPLDLISRIVKFRVTENMKKSVLRRKK
jgi:uncharacterized protein YdhG (YjbR/CyaY superfamily)